MTETISMLAALSLAVILFLGSVTVHMWSLRAADRWTMARPWSVPTHTGLFLAILFSHLAVAILFAGGFAFGVSVGLGTFREEAVMGWMDYFYFSLINITTLGLGDIYPAQHLRVVAGIESLTGFLLISCSAQLVWKHMKKGNA